jgi:F-type H+-transporting ATPase subunit delta
VYLYIFSKHICPLTLSFFKLIFVKGRSIAIAEILEAFAEMFRKKKGIQVVQMTTALALSDELKQSILKTLTGIEMLKGKTIELKEKVDPSIVGGMVLQIEDKLFDASIAGKLGKLKQELLNSYISK